MLKFHCALLFAGVTGVPTISYADTDCSPALLPEIVTISYGSEEFLSFLDIVNESNYSAAQKSASGKYKMFGGSYASFKEQRSALFKQSNYESHQLRSFEMVKQSLKDSQLAAWAKCKADNREIAVVNRDVTPTGATLYISWQPTAGIGKLEQMSFTVLGGTVTSASPNQGTPTELYGEASIIIQRERPDEEVRGKVQGFAGVNKQSYTASFFIPATPPAVPPPAVPPKRFVVPISNEVWITDARWAQGTKSAGTAVCFVTPAHFDLVAVEQQYSRGPWKEPRGCFKKLPNWGTLCESHGERCDLTIIKRGCLVASDWHAFYRADMRRLGYPYSTDAVCKPEPKSDAEIGSSN